MVRDKVGLLLGLGGLAIGSMFMVSGNPGSSEFTKLLKQMYEKLMKAEKILREDVAFRGRDKPVTDRKTKNLVDEVCDEVEEATNILDKVGVIALEDAIDLPVVIDKAHFTIQSYSKMLSSLNTMCELSNKYRITGRTCSLTYAVKLNTAFDAYKKDHNELLKLIEMGVIKGWEAESIKLFYKPESEVKYLIENLLSLDKSCREITGKKCLWFEEDDYRNLNISLSAIANDIAYMVHRFANKIAEVIAKLKETLIELHGILIVMLTDKPDPELYKAIETWAKAVSIGKQMKLYNDEDYKALKAYVHTKKQIYR